MSNYTLSEEARKLHDVKTSLRLAAEALDESAALLEDSVEYLAAVTQNFVEDKQRKEATNETADKAEKMVISKALSVPLRVVK